MQPEVQEALDRGFDERTVARQTVVDVKLAELSEEPDEVEATAGGAEEEKEEDSPVIRLVRSVLMGAYNAGASDIHLEGHEPEMRVRYRIDGELKKVMTINNHIEDDVIAQIKVRADMDTTETRRPQDGTCSLEENGHKVNFRVSCIPTTRGEKMCLRLLDEGSKVFELESISLTPRDLKRINSMIDKPHGMILITGPTGSGKSTTMYAMLSKLNSVDVNITTVEDPVEYKLAGINQVQSDNEFGMGFANALKFIMRQDPDVIMVGEIRDHETAATSVQAALTGHLLISTLHTNEAIGVVARLNDLGIDSFKVGGSLIGAVAQRLLRRTCSACKEPMTPTDAMIEAMIERGHEFPEDAIFYHGRGCKKCFGSGYAGRIPIFEVMVVTEEMAKAIECGVPTTKLEEIAREDGMVTLAGAGFEQALAGTTTLEEVYYKT